MGLLYVVLESYLRNKDARLLIFSKEDIINLKLLAYHGSFNSVVNCYIIQAFSFSSQDLGILINMMLDLLTKSVTNLEEKL